ncbi:MAG: hypothetical protein V8S95_07830 [Odoribacter sp.]
MQQPNIQQEWPFMLGAIFKDYAKEAFPLLPGEHTPKVQDAAGMYL